MMAKNCIAYLALEIPALSATFVYNEIFVLGKSGFQFLPFSVHRNQVDIKNIFIRFFGSMHFAESQ